MKSKCGRHLSYSIPTACGDFFVRDSFSEEFFGAVGILLEVESLTSVLLTMCPKLVPDGHMVETLVHDSNRRNRVSAHKRWSWNTISRHDERFPREKRSVREMSSNSQETTNCPRN
jgi:hypothetical protein